MAVDPLEVPRQAVADFGIEVVVTPAWGDAYPITALFVPATQDAALGQGRGHVAAHIFRCLPEEVANLAEGDLLTPVGGATYAVFEIRRIPGRLPEARVVER